MDNKEFVSQNNMLLNAKFEMYINRYEFNYHLEYDQIANTLIITCKHFKKRHVWKKNIKDKLEFDSKINIDLTCADIYDFFQKLHEKEEDELDDTTFIFPTKFSCEDKPLSIEIKTTSYNGKLHDSKLIVLEPYEVSETERLADIIEMNNDATLMEINELKEQLVAYSELFESLENNYMQLHNEYTECINEIAQLKALIEHTPSYSEGTHSVHVFNMKKNE